jgi:hypothetical protein
MTLLPLLEWRCCHPQVGIVALIAMVLLSSLMLRHPCHCKSIVALVAMVLFPSMRRHFAIIVIAIVALKMMVLLVLLMRRCPCHCRDGVVALVTMASLPLIHNCFVALVAMVSLPSSSWCCCPCCNGIVVIINAQASFPSSQWRCCPCHDGVVAIDAQAYLPLLQLQLLKRVRLSYLQVGLMPPLTSAVTKVTGKCLDTTPRCHKSDTLFQR